jgi:hypothetical protein
MSLAEWIRNTSLAIDAIHIFKVVARQSLPLERFISLIGYASSLRSLNIHHYSECRGEACLARHNLNPGVMQ